MPDQHSIKPDLSELLAVSQGNPVFLSKMFQIYREDFSLYLTELEGAWAKNDITDVRRIGHKMKSPAGVIKVKQIDALLDRIEPLESSNLPDSLEILTELKATFNSVKDTLEIEVKSISKNAI